jgi:hypothetical protein
MTDNRPTDLTVLSDEQLMAAYRAEPRRLFRVSPRLKALEAERQRRQKELAPVMDFLTDLVNGRIEVPEEPNETSQ